MPLHILMPFAVFGAVLATVALLGFIVFLICRYRNRRRTGLLDPEVAGCHNFHSASLLSLDKDEILESIQPRLSSKRWSAPRLSAEDAESCRSLGSASLVAAPSYDTLSLQSEVGTLMPMLYRKKGTVLIAESGVSEADRLGQLIFMVSYDFKTSDLIVKIDEARDLRLPAAAAFELFVRLSLHPVVDERKRQTSTVAAVDAKATFHEEFKFPVAHEVLPEHQLSLEVFQRPRTNEAVLLGRSGLLLNQLDVTADVQVLTDIAQAKNEVGPNGEVLVSLNYLPAAKRLTVGIMRARNLSRIVKKDKHEQLPDACCKVSLLVDGNVLKRKHTSVCRASRDPTWNEAVVFHGVSSADLPATSVLIAVAHSPSHFQHSLPLGHVRLGSDCAGRSAEHWHDMKLTERKNLAVWHSLVIADDA